MEETTSQDPGYVTQSSFPNCRAHGKLVLDLACGRLDDERAEAAEQVRTDCPVCRSWWQDALAGEHTAVVEAALAEVFSEFESPRRSHRRRWLAAAAAFLAAVLGYSALTRHDGDPVSGGEVTASQNVIVAEGFESGGGTRDGFALTAAPPATEMAIFEASFELGGPPG